MLSRSSKESFRDEGTPTLAVFSHPNHELAVFGVLQRLRPNIIYLTSGGSRKRLSETRKSLKSIGLLSQATFLNYPEQQLYDSLLACDHTLYKRIAAQVFALFDSLQPTQVICDAVEFYNPVHDLTLPIVQAALGTTDGVLVFEAPLIFQKSTKGEKYEVQRLPVSRRNEQIEIRLTEAELGKKLNARDHIYTSLLEQMGPLLSQLPRDHVGLEVVAPACSRLPRPGAHRILRYEWRAELLRSHGKIERVITYSNHYLPVASALL